MGSILSRKQKLNKISVMKKLLLTIGLMGTPFLTSLSVAEDTKYSDVKVNIEKLGQEYSGNNPAEVFVGMSRVSQAKGEFETTAEYEKRIAKIKAEPIYHDLYLKDEFAFQIGSGPLSPPYNADKEEFDISISGWNPFPSQSITPKQLALNLFSQIVSDGTYTATSDIGVTYSVKKNTNNYGYLVVQNLSKFKEFKKGKYIFDGALKTTILAKREVAKEVQNNIRAIALVSINEPELGQEKMTYRPTVFEPKDTTVNIFYLFGNVTKFIIYNYSTGEILKTIEPKK